MTHSCPPLLFKGIWSFSFLLALFQRAVLLITALSLRILLLDIRLPVRLDVNWSVSTAVFCKYL